VQEGTDSAASLALERLDWMATSHTHDHHDLAGLTAVGKIQFGLCSAVVV
jgi:hypothetical protein